MTRILIAAIGKARAGGEAQLTSEYIRRLPWKVTLKELESKKSAGPARTQEETVLLQNAASAADRTVVLDERGETLTSREFAERLAKWQREGAGSIAFLIGGADGVTADARKKADLLLSFGRLTWPHKLVRVMLAEQLYRASTLLSGHPYHRE